MAGLRTTWRGMSYSKGLAQAWNKISYEKRHQHTGSCEIHPWETINIMSEIAAPMNGPYAWGVFQPYWSPQLRASNKQQINPIEKRVPRKSIRLNLTHSELWVILAGSLNKKVRITVVHPPMITLIQKSFWHECVRLCMMLITSYVAYLPIAMSLDQQMHHLSGNIVVKILSCWRRMLAATYPWEDQSRYSNHRWPRYVYCIINTSGMIENLSLQAYSEHGLKTRPQV